MALDVKQTYEQTLSANGNTTWQQFEGPVWVSVSGTFGGGTAIIQRQDNAGSAVTVTVPSTITQTAAYDAYVEVPRATLNFWRVNLAGATSPDLDVMIQQGKRD